MLYGCTAKQMGDLRRDTNSLVSEWIDYDDKKTLGKQKRVIANVVDKDSLKMVKEFGFNIAKNIRNFLLVYTNTPEPQAGFGADTPLDSLTNGKMICMNGGVQSFLQVLNALNNNINVVGLTHLRSKDKDNFDPTTKKNYLSACDLLAVVKNKMGHGKSLQQIIKDYIREHALYNTSKPDNGTKQALWDQSMSLLKNVWLKLHLFQNVDCEIQEYKATDVLREQNHFRYIYAKRSFFVSNVLTKFKSKLQKCYEFSIMGLIGDESIKEIDQTFQTFVKELNPETGRNPDDAHFKCIKIAYKKIKNANLQDLSTKNPDELFEINENSTIKDIEKRYKKLSKKFHPDQYKSKEEDLKKIEIARLTIQFQKLLNIKVELIDRIKKRSPIPDESKQGKADFSSSDSFHQAGECKTMGNH